MFFHTVPEHSFQLSGAHTHTINKLVVLVGSASSLLRLFETFECKDFIFKEKNVVDGNSSLEWKLRGLFPKDLQAPRLPLTLQLVSA